MKKLLAVVLATVMLLALSACGKKNDSKPPVNAPETVSEMASTFIRAYYFKDMLTTQPLYLHDERQRWEEHLLKDHKTEEAFCAVVQQQADDKGLDVEIHTFNDYQREYYKMMLVEMEEMYGPYTLSSEITACTEMNAEALASFLDKYQSGFYAAYTTDEQIAHITAGYTLTVDFRIDGEIKDYHQPYTVYAVLCDGEWKVASHTS